jgi:hypothetical protein
MGRRFLVQIDNNWQKVSLSNMTTDRRLPVHIDDNVQKISGSD